MGKVMEELLIKAQRDKSKLVQVQRSVSRNGKTFMQNFWVQPSQVKSTDKVIGGQQNLLPKAGSVPKPAAGVLDKAYFESIKSDHTKAIDYLKSCGVQWNDHSHAGINWMRAMQAYNAAVGNQNGNKTASATPTQPTSQPSTQTAQVAQNPQGKGVTLTVAQQAEVDAGKNGKEKVVILKKLLGKDGCMEYAKQLGVTWDEHSMDAINNMRMSMALSKHFDTVDGTVSPTGGKGGKGGGAPKGNQNAKKDEVKKDDTIKVTSSHTARQATLIGLINGIADPKELELIKSTGIVAEDADAKAFIEKTLEPAYYKKDISGSFRGDSKAFGQNSATQFGSVLKGLPKRLVSSIFETMSKENEGLNMAVLQHPREFVAAFGSGNRGKIAVGESGVSAGFTDKSFLSIMDDLHKLSQLADDISLSNTGQPNDYYKGLLTAERIENLYKKHGVDAYGVIQAIHHISDKDPTVKAEADKMAAQYSSMLDKCNHGFTTLQTVLGNKYSYIEDQIETSKTNKKRIDATIKYFLDLKSQYNMSNDDVAESVYSLSKWNYNHFILQRADGTPILDSNGNQVNLGEGLKALGRSMGDDNLFSYIINDSQILKFLETALIHGKTYETLTQIDFNSSNHKHWGGYQSPLSVREAAKQFQGITQDSYSQIRTTYLDFVGQKVQQYDSTTDSYVDVDTSKWSAAEWSNFDDRINDYILLRSSTKREFRLIPNGDNPQKDTILANFHGISAHIGMMENIQNHVPSWCPASKANDQGNDLSKNFSYLTSRQAESGTMYWGQGTKMTGDQVNAQILAQLKDTPVVTSEMRAKLVEYSEKHGVDTASYGSSNNPMEVKMNKARSLNMSFIASIQGYQGTPMNDIIVEQIMSVAHCCPQMLNTRVKTQDDVDGIIKRAMGYIDTTDSGTSDLLALRQQAFAKVHCSLRTADQTQRDSIETRVKQDWDKGKRSSSGRRLYSNISFVGHGVYQIQNSEADEIFRENVKKTGETPQSFFHGTSFQGACGIVGVDGKFRAPKDSADAAKQGLKYAGSMLGPGVYLADLAGKSAGYFGTWGSGYARGALLVCDAILGKHATASDYSSVKTRMDVDSVSMKAGTNTGRTMLRADEFCVRRNDFVSPQFIVDAEAIPR